MATTEKVEKIEPGSFAALFEESMSLKEMRQGEVITAEVISVESVFVIVNAGLKSESVIKTEEFLSDNGEIDVAIGDLVKVAFEKLDSDKAYKFGLVDEIVMVEDLISRAHTLLDASLSALPNHVSGIKRLMN